MAFDDNDIYDDAGDEWFNDEEPAAQKPRGRSVAAKIVWSIYGVILLVVLSLTCFQIYRVTTGQVWSYGHPATAEQKLAAQKAAEAKAKAKAEAEAKAKASEPLDRSKFAKTEEVTKIAELPETRPQDLGGNNFHVDFRNSVGDVLCSITVDFKKYPESKWFVPYEDAEGNTFKGAGVVCASLRDRSIPKEQRPECKEGSWVVGTQFAFTDELGARPGVCVHTDQPLQLDSLRIQDKRLTTVKELPFGHRVQVGAYSCGFIGTDLHCASMGEGHGFILGDTDYKYF